MDLEVFDLILSDLGANFSGRVSLFHINEPLLDDRIEYFVSRTRKLCPDAFINIVTNGDLLTRTKEKALFNSGLSSLGVSIYDDAAMARIKNLGLTKSKLIDMRSISPARLENRAGALPHLAQHLELPLQTGCLRPNHMMVFKTNGEAVLCCSDMDGDYVLGSIVTQGLEEISDNYRKKFISLRNEGRIYSPCRECSYSGQAPRVQYP